MGPGLFSPDDSERVVGDLVVVGASMGPGLFSPDDMKSALLLDQSVNMLQWGRACSARMTRGNAGDAGQGNLASMGPGLFSPDDFFARRNGN